MRSAGDRGTWQRRRFGVVLGRWYERLFTVTLGTVLLAASQGFLAAEAWRAAVIASAIHPVDGPRTVNLPAFIGGAFVDLKQGGGHNSMRLH